MGLDTGDHTFQTRQTWVNGGEPMATRVTPEVDTLRQEIRNKYTEVATNPERTFHFHHGRPLAQMLGYPMDQVDAMPTGAVESFAGVGNPFSVGSIQPG